MDTLKHVALLRAEIYEKDKIILQLQKRLLKLECGSNKSLLNCHAEGKRNFQSYINMFYPNLGNPGNFIRRIIEQVEPYNYEDIIGGNF
jgi:hypothetical protein